MLSSDEDDLDPNNGTPHLNEINAAYMNHGMNYYPKVVSTDIAGIEKNQFGATEKVYCKGSGLPTNQDARIFVVSNNDDWYDHDALLDLTGGFTTVTTDAAGNFGPTEIWAPELSDAGDYDIVADIDLDGHFDLDFTDTLDACDDNNVAGFVVVRGDFGDAPDNTENPAQAYPGVPGRFPSLFDTKYGAGSDYTGVFHKSVSEEWLGLSPTSNTTVENDALVSDEDSDDPLVVLVYEIGEPATTGDIVFPVTAVEEGWRYINILLDQNRTGRWTDPTDYVVRDLPVWIWGGTRHVSIGPFPLSLEDKSHWVRITLTKYPLEILNWNGSIPPGGLARGETEDHLLMPQNIEDDPLYDVNGGQKPIYIFRREVRPSNVLETPICDEPVDFWIDVSVNGGEPGDMPFTTVTLHHTHRIRGVGPGPNIWNVNNGPRLPVPSCITFGNNGDECQTPMRIRVGDPAVAFPFSACYPKPKDDRLWRSWITVVIDPPGIEFDSYYPDSNWVDYIESSSDPTIRIQEIPNTIQGHFEEVSIYAEDSTLLMGGFDFLIAYDASALTYMGAEPGQLLEDCDWEYFTYRHGADGNCGDACPSGLLRIIAIAETANGPFHPSCYGPPDTDPHELANMKFLVTNDRTFECQYVPIRFFWGDCGDNTVSSVDGDTMYVSDRVYDFEGVEITDSTVGFPTYFGVQPECLTGADPEKPTPIRFIDFINGGIDIICSKDIDDRGDINLDGLAYTIADAVMFSNYFVYGLSAFPDVTPTSVDGAVAATDVNADGMTLSVADLVYLVRVIVGDAVPYDDPYQKIVPVAMDYRVDNGVLSVDGSIGAALVVVDGEVTPVNLTDNMEMKYRFDGEHTRVLLYSLENNSFTGECLEVDGNIVKIEMATDKGVPVSTMLIPSEFALHQCFPNPFNPITTITFALPTATEYELVIFNVLGEVVETFEGYSEPGIIDIQWDASGYASGVYLYRLTASDFVDSKKAVLLK
jgi:hypothetical protein